MIPDTVRTLTEIEELDGSEQLIHAVSLLDYLLAVSPKFQRDGEMETLGTVINSQPQHFAQIRDLNFALRVRNKIIHPRPANADDPDLTLASVRNAARYVIDTITRDVAKHVPPEIRAALLITWEDFAAAGSQSPPKKSDLYVAGWRYEESPPADSPAISRPLWQPPADMHTHTSKPPSWPNRVADWLKSMSPGQFWGVMSCVPLALLLVGLLLQQLSKILPANALVLGAVLLLVVVAVRWLGDS
jgi:hypothetical protein